MPLAIAVGAIYLAAQFLLSLLSRLRRFHDDASSRVQEIWFGTHPHGVIVADAGEREHVLAAAAEVEVVTAWRRDFPALKDAHWAPATTTPTA